MRINKMQFVKYISSFYPEKVGKEKVKLPEGVKYYAVPGGGVATEDACRLWALRNKVAVTFA